MSRETIAFSFLQSYSIPTLKIKTTSLLPWIVNHPIFR